MSPDPYRLLAYWENRKETAEACAARFARMIARLAEIDPCFAQWCKQANRRSAAYKPFCRMPPDLAELTRIFDRNRERYESPPVVWPELGFSIGAWNGLEHRHAASFTLAAGEYDSSREFPNHIFLSLPDFRLETGEAWTASGLKPLIMAVVEAWDARFVGVIGSRAFNALPSNPAKNKLPWFPWAGWVSYLAPPAALRVTPPEGIDAVRLADGGLLIALTEAPFDIGDPVQRARSEAMNAALRPVQR